MAHIKNPDYETFTVRCDHCQACTLFNRVEVGRFTELDSTYLNCPACGCSFWVTGDIANPPYELFIWDADRHFAEKRYMLSITSLCLAWEVFMATLARTTYLDRPYFNSLPDLVDDELQKELADLFNRVTRKFTFFPLRNLVINTILHKVAPTTQKDARAAILQIESQGFGNDVAPERIGAIEKKETRELLLALHAVTVGTLRNKVLHQNAYRPLAGEANYCRETEVVLLYQLQHAFGVDDYPSLMPLGV